jgi:hypothetical protein
MTAYRGESGKGWLAMYVTAGFWHRSWGAVAECHCSRIILRSSSNPARP